MPCRSLLLLSVGVLGAGVLVLLAQSQKAPTSEPSSTTTQLVRVDEISGPATTEHQRLAPFVGEFDQTVEVRTHPDQPVKVHVLATGEWIMGGRYVRIAAHTAPDEQRKGERLTIYGYDMRAKKYTMWSIESGTTFAVSAMGDFDPDTKTFTLEGERYGEGTSKVPFRWVLRLEDGGAFTQEILIQRAGGQDLVTAVVVKNTPRGK